MPTRTRLDEFIAVVESGDHAGAIERYYTEDSSMQENTAPPRVGRDGLVAHERAVLARMSQVYSKAISSVVKGDHVAIHWNFELTDKTGKVRRFDEGFLGLSIDLNPSPGSHLRCDPTSPTRGEVR